MTAIYPLYPLHDPMPKTSADAPIGIFDSGVGGLSIAQEIANYLPNEHFIYYADTAHVPYGPRDDQEIRELRHMRLNGYIVKVVKWLLLHVIRHLRLA